MTHKDMKFITVPKLITPISWHVMNPSTKIMLGIIISNLKESGQRRFIIGTKDLGHMVGLTTERSVYANLRTLKKFGLVTTKSAEPDQNGHIHIISLTPDFKTNLEKLAESYDQVETK